MGQFTCNVEMHCGTVKGLLVITIYDVTQYVRSKFVPQDSPSIEFRQTANPVPCASTECLINQYYLGTRLPIHTQTDYRVKMVRYKITGLFTTLYVLVLCASSCPFCSL